MREKTILLLLALLVLFPSCTEKSKEFLSSTAQNLKNLLPERFRPPQPDPEIPEEAQVSPPGETSQPQSAEDPLQSPSVGTSKPLTVPSEKSEKPQTESTQTAKQGLADTALPVSSPDVEAKIDAGAAKLRGAGPLPIPGMPFLVNLLILEPGRKDIPEDFDSGTIVDEESGTPRQRLAMKTAISFMDSVAAKKIDNKLISSEKTDEITRLFHYYLAGDISFDRYRLFALAEEEDGLFRVSVRMYSGKSRADGELTLISGANDVKVFSAALDFIALSGGAEVQTKKFEPEEYRPFRN